MAMIDSILNEMEQEAAATRRLLERVPDDQLGWRPHPKSYSLGQIALHIGHIPSGVSTMASLDTFDLAQRPVQKEAQSRAEILEAFEGGLESARAVLTTMDDQRLCEPWSLTDQGDVVMTMPRIALLRSIMLNHCYHHRGQLVVYLRLLNVPIPSVYGPTADENPFARPRVAAP